jgi:hypothetical protein
MRWSIVVTFTAAIFLAGCDAKLEPAVNANIETTATATKDSAGSLKTLSADVAVIKQKVEALGGGSSTPTLRRSAFTTGVGTAVNGEAVGCPGPASTNADACAAQVCKALYEYPKGHLVAYSKNVLGGVDTVQQVTCYE